MWFFKKRFKIDGLVNKIKNKTDEVIIISNRETIRYYLSDFDFSERTTAINEAYTEITKVHRKGVFVYFIDNEDVTVDFICNFKDALKQYEILNPKSETVIIP